MCGFLLLLYSNLVHKFIIFVNDLDDGVISKLLKFADDVKLIGPVASERDVDSLRADLQLLVEEEEEYLFRQ